MTVLAALLLAAAVDGEAAARHAAALRSLGPRPWGSANGRAAAAYVAAQLQQVGLADVRQEDFEVRGVRGVNVVAELPGTGPGIVVLGAHHDTAIDPPGVYDNGGGVGVLIEVARALAREPRSGRTIVFASWDGEEAWATGLGTTTGSRAWVLGLGPRAEQVAGAITMEVIGRRRPRPVLLTNAYYDPRRPGGQVVAPGWLVAAALSGAREVGAPLRVSDPWLSWIYQPAVRTFVMGLYGDDLALLQAGIPAVLVSDARPSTFNPWYRKGADPEGGEDGDDELVSAAALQRMGESVRGAMGALARRRLPRGPDPDWYSMYGRVAPRWMLLVAGLLALAPGLARLRNGRWRRVARLVQAVLFAVLVWLNPVPALWVLVAPVVATGLWRSRLWLVPALLPALALIALGVTAAVRGAVIGTWIPAWQQAAALAVILLAAVQVAPARSARPVNAAPARLPREL